MIETGKVLQQRYRIDKQIGVGGMGAVYVATDERFGSTVAIKETLCMDENFRKAIEREARLLNSLKHVALPRVSDHFLEADGQFLVMEFVPGEDLNFILERDGRPFPIDTVMTWADQLLDALEFLHHQEIPVVHRDIKPQNLKVTPQGQIILLDFGLAKGNPTDAGHQTAAKSIFGYSRNYASLEQIQGTGTDPRSDLYSLAATLYHLLTGVAPEDALTRAMSVLSQKDDPLIPANVLRPTIPAGVAGVLQRAMDLNAASRPNSAAEMRQMFRESERYAQFAGRAPSTQAIHDPQVLGQPTKLMSDNTRSAEPKNTDLKTELLPEYKSEITAIRPESAAAAASTSANQMPITQGSEPPRGRGKALAAAGIGLLLACGLLAGGIYVAKPSVFTGVPPAEKPSDKIDDSAANRSADNSTPDTNSSAEQPESASGVGITNSSAPATGEKIKPPTVPEKPSETTKATRPSTPEQPRTDQNSVDDQVTTETRSGDTVVTRSGRNGTETRIYKNGRIVVNPQRPPNPNVQFPKGIDFQNMTPVQRRKLRQLMMRSGQHPPNP